MTFNESQSFESVVLGENGTINFTSTLNVYTIKVEIKNTFSNGGRNIEVNFESAYTEGFDSIRNVKCVESDGGEFSFDFENGCWVVSPGKTLILWFEYTLDADKSESFDTSEIENFSLLEIHLKRL